jgi:hypothetical protein
VEFANFALSVSLDKHVMKISQKMGHAKDYRKSNKWRKSSVRNIVCKWEMPKKERYAYTYSS